MLLNKKVSIHQKVKEMKTNQEMKLLNGVSTVLINCRQWGDTGKGKFVDIFADWADIIVRGTGGDNAGHTICYEGKELITHLIPSGILRDAEGKINIIGSGVVLYPRTLILEMKQLHDQGLSYNHLKIALNAKLITPAEILLDRIKESVAGKTKIGSTGKGIGPAYADFVNRQGLLVNDLLNPSFFREKLKKHLNHKRRILQNYDPELIKKVMMHEHLESGLYYDSDDIFDFEAISKKYLEYGQELKPYITDTDSFVRSQLGVKKILGEGAQGDLLSIKHGTYPYVTSSDCSSGGLAEGMGLTKNDIDLSLGIVKFYTTRVGNGPFPTELGGEQSDRACNSGLMDVTKELAAFGLASLNDPDEFIQGVGLRQAGREYGATTGRPRRVGWMDLPLLRYVLGFNTKDIIFTKVDVLDNCETIKVCHEYLYQGETYHLGGDRTIEKGDRLSVAIPAAEILQYCEPVYTSFPGWKESLSDCSEYEDLPKELQDIIHFIISKTKICPRIISIGADRKKTIYI